MKKTLIVALTLSFSAVAAAATSASPNHPINVTSCQATRGTMVAGGGFVPAFYPAGPYYFPTVYGYQYYQPPVRTSNPTLAIDYSNAQTQTMTSIEFGLVVNGSVVAEVKDVGKFSPGVEIKHEFGIPNAVFPLRGMARCVPLKITFADGTKWRNPKRPMLLHRLQSH